MSSDAKEHIRDKLRCRPTGAVASARPRESAAFFSLPKPDVRWSKMCTGQSSFCLPFGFYFSLGCFHWLFASLFFCFLDKAGVFAGSSIVVPPVFPFFSPCLPCQFVFWFVFVFLPSSSPFSSSAFITSSFLLRICVYICLFCWFPFHFLEGFLWRRFFPFFNFNLCTGCQGVKMYFWVLWSVWIYIPCRIGKDGGFIWRDRSFQLPRINLAKAGWCVTDTISKKFMSVWVSRG